MKQAFVYILASQKNGTLYIGVTSNIVKRVYEHKKHLTPGFTSKYCANQLVYFEPFEDMRGAIEREKKLKAWPRSWKMKLIEDSNPEWSDLYSTFYSSHHL